MTWKCCREFVYCHGEWKPGQGSSRHTTSNIRWSIGRWNISVFLTARKSLYPAITTSIRSRPSMVLWMSRRKNSIAWHQRKLSASCWLQVEEVVESQSRQLFRGRIWSVDRMQRLLDKAAAKVRSARNFGWASWFWSTCSYSLHMVALFGSRSFWADFWLSIRPIWGSKIFPDGKAHLDPVTS